MDDSGIWVVGVESRKDRGVRAAEAVDCLLRISDGAKIASCRRQGPEQRILSGIEVLEFVDGDPREAFSIVRGNSRVCVEQLYA